MDEYAAPLGLGMNNVVAPAGNAGRFSAVKEGVVRPLWADQPELDEALGASD